MATALASGLVRAKLAAAAAVLAADPSPAAREQFAGQTGCRVVGTNREVAAGANVIFLAVKPQSMSAAIDDLNSCVGKEHLVISIAAGVPLAALSAGLGAGPRLVRVMPNTPCLVGCGASAYCLGPGATAADDELVSRMLSAVGTAHRVDESLLDAVTGLSGSGPALVYVVIEALSDGGVQAGLPRELALALAAQTVRGAAEMVLKTGQHPGVLKDAVASPAGTTIAGLAALETAGVRGALIAAVVAATRRSQELGALSQSKKS